MGASGKRRRGIDRASATISAGAHLLALGAAWLASLSAQPALEFVIPEVALVSPAPPESAEVAEEAAREVVVETPDPPAPEPEPETEPDPPPVVEEEPEPVEPEPDPEPEPEPEPEDPPAPAQPVEEPAEVAEEAASVTTEEETETEEEAGEGINVRLEGVRRDYPEYYENIIRQINRCFRRPAEGSWETTIAFAIQRDGSVTDARFLTRSGSAAFDFQAMRAIVDCAGRGRFGPLPEGLTWESLPVAFDFRPSGGGLEPGASAPKGDR